MDEAVRRHDVGDCTAVTADGRREDVGDEAVRIGSPLESAGARPMVGAPSTSDASTGHTTSVSADPGVAHVTIHRFAALVRAVLAWPINSLAPDEV